MKTVIIGGVAGGASAAARLRRLDESMDIVMLERSGYVSYANCGLPYYVGGTIQDKEKLTLQTPGTFARRFNVDARVLSEVVSIDRSSKTVKVRDLSNGSEYLEDYDYLIVSTGAEARRPDVPGIDDERVMTLRTVEDSFRMRRFIEENHPRTAVICGGGYIGTETAECLTEAGIKVTIVQRPDHLLPQLDREMAADVHHHIRSKGVDLVLSDALTGFDTDDGLNVCLKSGKKLGCDMAVIALGIVPDTHLAKEAGLEMGVKDTVAVDPHMRTSDPCIYAVGDAVQVNNIVTGSPSSIALAGPANKQGRIAADNIAGLDSEYDGSIGASVVKVFDMTVGSAGITEKQAESCGIPHDCVITYSASHATYYPGAMNMTVKTVFDPDDGRILGAQITGYDGVDKRTDVMAIAIRCKMSVRDLAELELSYAPPYSSAKDPVNYAGFVACNLMDGLVKQFEWNEVDCKSKDGSNFMVDVRSPKEFELSHLDGAINIPVDDIRSRMNEIPKDKHICLICHSALRSYIAARILMQNGYDCSHLAGGYRLYSSVIKDLEIGSPADMPCGEKR